MTRPRIRTLKPEMWQDESVGALSHGARLTLVGLITMADDEGRLRAMPAAIIGHVFPWDEITPRKLSEWLSEIARHDVIVQYESDGNPYIAFRHWRRHQRLNRPTISELPASSDAVITADNAVPNSLNAHDTISEQDVRTHANGRADSVRTHA